MIIVAKYNESFKMHSEPKGRKMVIEMSFIFPKCFDAYMYDVSIAFSLNIPQ